MSIEAMKQMVEALEALECIFASTHPYRDDGSPTFSDKAVRAGNEAITACKQGLEQPEPEPVAYRQWVPENPKLRGHWMLANPDIKDQCLPKGEWEPLYTSPPKREPLSDEQIEDKFEQITGHSIFGGNRNEGRTMYLSPDEVIEFARAIEAAHGIKGEE
jgi:hypothetical protein